MILAKFIFIILKYVVLAYVLGLLVLFVRLFSVKTAKKKTSKVGSVLGYPVMLLTKKGREKLNKIIKE